jgi:hypothetical protein
MLVIRACSHCGQKNRIPAKYLASTGRCGNWKWSPLVSGRIARVTRRSDLSARKSLCFRPCDAGKETLAVELLSAFAACVHRKL